MQYLFVGTHPESLASGRPLVFGDTVDATALDAWDKRLIAAGQLVEAPSPQLPSAPTVALPSVSPAASTTTPEG